MIDDEYCSPFEKKVGKLSKNVGCSHHPRGALLTLMTNSWGQSNDYNSPEVFENSYAMNLLPKIARNKLSPKERFAYETLRFWFFQAPSLAYFCGRVVRNWCNLPERNAHLDDIFEESVMAGCGDYCAHKAYSIEFPISSTLDKMVGGLFGIAFSLPAFVTGLAYTP